MTSRRAKIHRIAFVRNMDATSLASTPHINFERSKELDNVQTTF